MTLLSITPSGRIYQSNDLWVATEFALKFRGIILANYEEAIKGIFFVKI